MFAAFFGFVAVLLTAMLYQVWDRKLSLANNGATAVRTISILLAAIALSLLVPLFIIFTSICEIAAQVTRTGDH